MQDKKFHAGLNLKNKTIVATNGCFDILHIGHVRYLHQAKALGDVLVIGINSDQSVKELKGLNRPINRAEDRAEILQALSCVDFTYIFEQKTADEFLKIVKPNIYVKGGDYSLEELPEKSTLEKLNIQVTFLPFQDGYSTTSILQKSK